MGTRIDRRFDYLRKQTEQDAERQGQEQTDALQRQAASRGRLGSGSYQKVQMQANEALQKQKQNAIEGVESQREAALAQKEEADVNRQFARDERLGAQDFAFKSQKQSEGFQEGMWNKQEEVRRKESHDAAWQAQRNFETQMKMANNQWTKQFKLDKEVSKFNMEMAARSQQLAERPGMMDRLMNPFSNGGFGGGTWDTRRGATAFATAGGSELFSGGGGGGGKIICTEYCRQGWISEEVLRGDLEYAAKHLTKEVRANYLMWAQYVVPAMQKYPVLLYFMWPITYNWVHYMAWKMGRYPHKPFFGPFVEKSATRISNILGRTIRKLKKWRKHGSPSLSTST